MSIPRLVSFRTDRDEIFIDKSGYFDSNTHDGGGGETSEDSDSHIFADQLPSRNRNYGAQSGQEKRSPIEVRRGWGERKEDEFVGPEDDGPSLRKNNRSSERGERSMQAERNLTLLLLLIQKRKRWRGLLGQAAGRYLCAITSKEFAVSLANGRN